MSSSAVDATVSEVQNDDISLTITYESEKLEFCFETDHVALKGNTDYQNLLKRLAILEGQRLVAVKNMEMLIPLKSEALKSPLAFIQKLQRGEKINFPVPQEIAQIPEISWEKYGVTIPDSFNSTQSAECKNPATTSECETNRESEKIKDGKLLVRGREFNQKKPETFNQLWTPEEQKRLEELLTIYPPEQVEMERFRKIAKALGNRTPLQVQSRVQKYFIKLQKAGLPVPGRTYNFSQYSNSRKAGHRHQRNNRFLFPSSTFFASATPPVYMNDLDDIKSNIIQQAESPTPCQSQDSVEVSDEDVPDSVKNSQTYAELMWLKLVRRAKQKQNGSSPPVHHGYRCDHCGQDPIVGTRWHCNSCPSPVSTDLCDNCAVHLASMGGQHQPNHRLVPVIRADSAQHGPSYLQSNFMPEAD